MLTVLMKLENSDVSCIPSVQSTAKQANITYDEQLELYRFEASLYMLAC